MILSGHKGMSNKGWRGFSRLKGLLAAGFGLVAFLAQGAPTLHAAAQADIRRDATVTAIETAMPSVVNISAKTMVQRRGYFFDWWRDNWSPFYQQLPPQYSAGSGVIIDEDGYVLTNVHVVEQADEIAVKLWDNRVIPAEVVIGTRRSDVALLKLLGKPGEKFSPVKFAGEDDLLLGETVIALGNPFGLGASVSRGILSSKTRRASSEKGSLDMEDWLQTDAAINPGNSGGPLVNLHGALIGLNVAIYKEGQGIGFAIPVKRLSEALSEIFTPEALKSLWCGARFSWTTNGVAALSVQPGSPADKGGLRAGDAVLKVNGKPAKSLIALNREIMAAGEKQDVSLQTQRGGAQKSVSFRLVPESSVFNAQLIRQKTGLTAQEITPEMAARAGLSSVEGLVVSAIEKNSPADAAGIQRGFVIQAVDGQSVDGLVAAAKIVYNKKKGDLIQFSLVVPRGMRRAVVELRAR